MSDDRELLRRLETTMTNGLQTLLSNTASDAAPLAARLRRENVHITQVHVYIGESERDQRAQEILEMERWLELAKKVQRHVSWKDFVFACCTKVDVSVGSRWKKQISEATGHDLSWMNVYQRIDSVPTEWLEKVYGLPDWTPPVDYHRNNFSIIAVELVAALRSAGKSSVWIANTLTTFLREFNGTKVERADVTNTPPS